MKANRLVLSGIVCKAPLRKVSPSGIPQAIKATMRVQRC